VLYSEGGNAKKTKDQIEFQSPEEIKQKALESIKDPELQKLFEGILEKTTIEKEALQTSFLTL
jgi:hypothetical protein